MSTDTPYVTFAITDNEGNAQTVTLRSPLQYKAVHFTDAELFEMLAEVLRAKGYGVIKAVRVTRAFKNLMTDD